LYGLVTSMSTYKAIELLKEHRTRHIAVFAKQMEGWRKAHAEWSTKMDAWREDPDAKRPSEPPVPQDYTKYYDELIERLEYHRSVDPDVSLDTETYEAIVRDRWQWRGAFVATSAAYNVDDDTVQSVDDED